MKKYLAYIVALSLLLSFLPVGAKVIDNPSFKNETSVLTVKGTIENAKQYDGVTVKVLRPGMTDDNLNTFDKEEIKKVYAGFAQTYVDNNGNYKVDFKISGETGYYNIIVKADSLSEVSTYKYFFSTPKDKGKLIDKISKVQNKDELKALLDLDNLESVSLRILDINYEVIKDLDKNKLANVIFEVNKENMPTEEKIDLAKENILLSSLIEEINEGKLSDLSSHIDKFNLSDKYLSLYNKLTEAGKADVLKNISNKNLTNIKSVNTKISDETLLSFINNKTSWEDYLYIIENFGEELGLSTDTINKYNKIKNQGMLADLLNGSYATKEEFKMKATEKINKIYSKEQKPSNSGGGGGGGGGGSSSGGHIIPPVVTPPVIPEPVIFRFSDVDENSFAFDAINKLYEKGIIKGVSENLFAPENPVKREEFVKMIVSAFNIVSAGEIDFADVPKDSWAYPFIKRAYGKGIIKGESVEIFGMGKELKRADASLILFNILNVEPIESEAFKDDNDIPSYAKEAVYTLKAMNILKGNTEGLFEPKRALTRAECAYIIYKISEGV